MDVNGGPTSSTATSNPRVKIPRFATSGTGGQGSAVTSQIRGASCPRRVPHRRALFGKPPSSKSGDHAVSTSGESRNDIPSTSTNIPKTPESSPEKMDEE
ncbi:hypothetical protein B9Z55_024357 [Caenorhabditis nigoni]|uniref:Uncharacterized protein n=1 Tax=Caenorhabditis nigoni TaxID=1611254 RepID=A0A2G5SUE0_9PELO|nr:hypothetical protein B9Z55_024357 [Caenorhabditis nigoni]